MADRTVKLVLINDSDREVRLTPVNQSGIQKWLVGIVPREHMFMSMGVRSKVILKETRLSGVFSIQYRPL